MNISPDDFKKLGIDESNLDEKAEQTTYKIKYVTRYVRQWVRIEANRKEIQQINFIDCMCNAGVYKDGDACTALEVIEDFNGLAKQFPSKKFVVYLNDIDKERIEIFSKIYQKYILPQKSSNLRVCSKNKDVNDYLDMIAADSQNKQDFFAYGKCNLIYVDPYNFGTVQISKLHAILENNYCELLFNLFTSDYVRNIAKDTGRIQKCLGGFKPATKDEFINYVIKELHVGHVKFIFSYSFHTMKNVELYQILYATPSIRGLEVLKDSLWDVFGGEEFHRNHVPKTSDVEQISMFDFLDPEEQRLREYAQEAKHLIYEEFKSQTVEYAVIEQKILEKTMLKKSQIIKHVLRPMITDRKLEKHNDAGKANFTKDNYTFI